MTRRRPAAGSAPEGAGSAAAAGAGDAGAKPASLGALATLGLPRGASTQDVETAHGLIQDFLAQAPEELRAWASGISDSADEALARLSDGPDSAPAPAAVIVAPAVPAQARGSWFAGSGARALLISAVVVAVVVGVYISGGKSKVPGISGTPTNEPTSTSSVAAVDQAKVGELMQKISANPKDVASLAALGDLYFAAGDYTTAAVWEQKIIEADAKNVTARIALGAAYFNLGRNAEAEKEWLAVVALDPKQAEAHYDLGFLYLSQETPDLAKVRIQWQTVIDIDPTAEIAKTVKTHLDQLDKQATGTPSTSGSATPSTSSSGS